MSVRNNTPPINATGTYVLRAPFATVEGAIYRCEAIDGFEALEGNDVNVFETYYHPFGLDVETYDSDALNGINIITLMSDNQPTITVPSSYIDSYPTSTAVPYSRIFLSVDLGVLPDGVYLNPAIEAVTSEVASLIGVPEPGVQIHSISSTTYVSFSEHEMLENNRAQRIVEKETPVAAVERLTVSNQSLRQRIEELENLVLEQLETIEDLRNP